MTFVASLVLVFTLLIRPQEIWPWVESLHLLEVFTVVAVVGVVIDVAQGKAKLYTPQLPFLLGFLAIAYSVTILAIGLSRGLTQCNKIPAIFMLAVAYGTSTVPRMRAMIWLLLGVGALVSAVAVHQGLTPPTCMQKVQDEETLESFPDPETADGRECGLPSDCRPEGDFDTEWACEHLGLFKTMSVSLRVRWRGQLNDPNELSVFVGGVLPLLFAVGLPMRNAASSRGPGRQRVLQILAFGLLLIGLWTVILTMSRGGQLVIATVMALLFVSRYGKKGLVLGLLLALPVLLLGGRSDEAADDSSNERAELLYEGINLVFAHPIKGVGVEQFSDQVQSSAHLTAHNSYLLACAEMGFPGFFMWLSLLWSSLKIPLTARKTPSLSPEIRAMAQALVVSFAGIAVGIFFLSFAYKQLLFMWFGLAGGFYGLMRKADPNVRVTYGWRDALGVAAANVGIIGLLYVWTRAKGTG